MFDFHRHFTQSPQIKNAFYATSSPEEWEKKAPFMSYGILANNLFLSLKEYENLLSNKLKDNPSFHVGEIALDNRFDNIDRQIQFFNTSLKLAAQYDRILTIHVVNENDRLIKILQENSEVLPKHIIYHGYNKSVELAKQLKKYRVTVSINPSVIKTNLFKQIKELDKIGFLLESDWDKENDDNYYNYFNGFIKTIKSCGIENYKDINNEFRAILENY